jgi:hypothetical protein
MLLGWRTSTSGEYVGYTGEEAYDEDDMIE